MHDFNDFAGSSKPQTGPLLKMIDFGTGTGPVPHMTVKAIAAMTQRSGRQILRLAQAGHFGYTKVGKINSRVWINLNEANAYFATHKYVARGPKGQPNGGRPRHE